MTATTRQLVIMCNTIDIHLDPLESRMAKSFLYGLCGEPYPYKARKCRDAWDKGRNLVNHDDCPAHIIDRFEWIRRKFNMSGQINERHPELGQ